MSLDLSVRAQSSLTPSIEDAIFETLVYSDIFDYPLSPAELHRYLPVPASLDAVERALRHPGSRIGTAEGFYFLAGRDNLVEQRHKRNIDSNRPFRQAVRFGRVLGGLPFIRMVGLTGSLALRNAERTADIDYLIIAEHGRLWTARAFALLFGRATSSLGYTLCPNLILSDQHLEWEPKDLYSARELCQMIPLAGSENYSRLRQANAWTQGLLPNAAAAPNESSRIPPGSILQHLAEMPLRGSLSDQLEAWEMNRKIRRFRRLAGFGTETVFNENLCQGNFNHHALQTRSALRERLRMLGFEMRSAPPTP